MLTKSITSIDEGGLSILDFCKWSGLGRTAAYEELRSGRLRAKKCGRRTIIPKTEASSWLESLPDYDIPGFIDSNRSAA